MHMSALSLYYNQQIALHFLENYLMCYLRHWQHTATVRETKWLFLWERKKCVHTYAHKLNACVVCWREAIRWRKGDRTMSHRAADEMNPEFNTIKTMYYPVMTADCDRTTRTLCWNNPTYNWISGVHNTIHFQLPQCTATQCDPTDTTWYNSLVETTTNN